MKYPQAIQSLIDKLSQLPSVGPKTAERYAFYLLGQENEKLADLALTISELKSKIIVCQSCHVLTESNPCPICADNNRQQDILCIVENTQDLLALESTKQYNGRYFILGGLINTLDGIGPEQLNISHLIKLIKLENIKELILALNFTLEGETTSLYINKIFKENLRITRLAKGLPAGSDLEYTDKTTLASALENRNTIK